MFQRIQRNQLLIISLVTGILLALSWPARGFPFLVFVAFVPLLWTEDQVVIRRKEIRAASFFLYAWISFFVFNLATTWWIMYATLPGMIVAVLLNALFMAIPWWLMHISRRMLPETQGPLSIIIFWLSFEFLHARWELSWSWLDLGNVFAAYPAWIQWYDTTGTAGGSLWILCINLLLFYALKAYLPGGSTALRTRNTQVKRHFHKNVRWYAGLALALFLVPAAISWTKWLGYREIPVPVEVVVIQPSEDPYEPVRSQGEAIRRLDHMIALADEKISPATRFVLAPEGANPQGIWMHEAEMNTGVQRLQAHMEQHPGLVWIIGSFTYRMYEAGEEIPLTARPYGEGGRHFDVFNSAVMIEAGQPLQYHHKSKLVPGIERMPYFRYLEPLGRLVDRFGGISGSLGTQAGRSAFVTSDHIRVAPSVCYESIYGDYTAEYIQDGAGLLFIGTNDGWWRDTPGYRQHLQYARLRAVELRRSIARSASTGISAFIGQRGEIIAQTSWWEAESMAATLNENYAMSFYARTGNFLGKMSLFLFVFFVLYVFSQRMIKGSKSVL